MLHTLTPLSHIKNKEEKIWGAYFVRDRYFSISFSASSAFAILRAPFSAVLRRNLDHGRCAFFPSALLRSVLGRLFLS